MKLLSVKPSEKKDKRYVAEFCSCDGKSKCKSERRKKTHFGYKSGSTYIDHKDNQKKDAYIARHQVNEDWTKPTSAGSLSRYILWGPTTSLRENIKEFKQKFNC